MHDPAIDDSEYIWPTCVSCRRNLWTIELDRQACRPCEDRTAVRIIELPILFRQLDSTAMLMRGARRPGAGSSGTRTAPIPARLEVLALVGPGGVAARLQAIEDSWRKALDWQPEIRSDGVRIFAPWREDAAEAVPQLARFIANNLLWACSSYESVADDIDEIRRLHSECMALVNDERRPGRVQIGNCPVSLGDSVCWAPLTASAASHRVHCTACGTRWETLGEWRELRAAQERMLAEMAGVAA